MNIAVVEDDQRDRDELVGLLRMLLEPFRVPVNLSEFGSGEAFLAALAPERFDVCLLDIYMDGLDGMETARRLIGVDPECLIVFLSNSTEYVYEGYEVNAVRYLRKPVEVDKLVTALRYCVEKTELSRRRLAVRIGKKDREIPYTQILYVATVGSLIEVHTTGGVHTLTAHSVFSETVAPLLADYRFRLSCRGVVVNLAHVRRIDGTCFELDNEERVPISRRLMGEMRDAFLDFLFECGP